MSGVESFRAQGLWAVVLGPFECAKGCAGAPFRISPSMSSSRLKSDDCVLPLYRQGGSLNKVGYFKAAHFKINYDDSFRDFLKLYRHAILSRVRVKRVKEGGSREPCSGAWKAIKFHPYYFVLRFTLPMLCFFFNKCFDPSSVPSLHVLQMQFV